MANTLGVCLIALTFFCCTNLSLARQVPKECNKGPSYWCQSLRAAADCGAVGHCTSTVWEMQTEPVRPNEISDRVVHLFKQLKDVKDLINADYLSTRVRSECVDMPYPAARQLCKENTAHLDEYLMHVLASQMTAEDLCRVVGMCNNDKLENILLLNKKKTQDVEVTTENHVAPNRGKSQDVEVTTEAHVAPNRGKLIGSEKCTWGPSYWCSNFSTGRECRATHHCVQRVWSKLELPVDDDGVCKICLNMVKQARDQLESNETQEELKEVFDGSCNLIPIKLVAKECRKLADDFIPELVETLASQMNPQQVCAVAGLCNNAKIDHQLERYNTRLQLREGCNNCARTVGVLRKRFDDTSYEDFLVSLLKVCGRVGSLSDSCSMLVFKYYENIVAAVKQDLTADSVCHLSGQCAFRYHEHDEFVFPTVVQDELKATDDVPCEFCEQLVTHMRNTLIANTTEMEFQRVLKGLCKQTGKFKDECLHLVDEYYAEIYDYLVNNMKPDEVCAMMGLCKNKSVLTSDVPIAPLLPRELAVKAVTITPATRLIGQEEAKIARIPLTKQSNVRIMGSEPASAPLPVERMMVRLPAEQGGKKMMCTFCQSFLHYMQVEISDTNNEEKVKEAVEKACNKLPESVEGECKQFVTEYGPAVIALLVQQIDPSSVCPALHLCDQVTEVRRVDINAEKSNCPLCLFAVEQLESMLKNNRSESNIRHALENLCGHLSAKLRTQCVDFVDLYSKQLVEMLVADMDAQEICVFLKLCDDSAEHTDPLKLAHHSIDKYHNQPRLMSDRNNVKKPLLPAHMLVKTIYNRAGDIETNEIPDDTVNGRVVQSAGPDTVCVVCEFVLKEIDDQIKDKHNEDEIKKVVHGVCKRMPKSVKPQCDQFVEKYADLVISLLAQELDPSEVCEELKLCKPTNNLHQVRQEILDCAVCETVVMAVKKVLTNDRVDRDIVHIVEKSCGMLPAKYSRRCHMMMEIYGDSVIHLIEEMGTKGVCAKIGLCSATDNVFVRM